MTGYNDRYKRQLNTLNGLNQVIDPGAGGVLEPYPIDDALAILVGAGTRTLFSATEFSEGQRFTVLSKTNAVIVDGVTIDNGEFAEFMVTLDASGDKQWVTTANSATVANAAIIPASAGTYEFLNTPSAVDNLAGLLVILAALETAGLIDDSGITQA